jgi:hypothetical protein
MAIKRQKRAPRKGSAAQPSDIEQFAHHLAEAIRIARYSEAPIGSLYNDLAGAWNDFENEMPSLSAVSESEAYINLALNMYVRQIAEKGGAR